MILCLRLLVVRSVHDVDEKNTRPATVDVFFPKFNDISGSQQTLSTLGVTPGSRSGCVGRCEPVKT